MGAPRIIATLTTGLLAVFSVSACEATQEITGPDPEDAAEALAAALVSGEFTDLSFADTTVRKVTMSYREVVAGMGEVAPEVETGDVDRSGDAATSTLRWTWPVGEEEWSYYSEADFRLVGDVWRAVWDPSVIEGSLDEGVVLDQTSVTPKRAPILGAGGLALVADRPVTRFGIDRSQVPAARAPESARRLATLLQIDVGPYVGRVEASGDEAFVEGIVYRREDVPLRVAQGFERIPGAIALAAEQPLAPTREFAAPILGTVGEVTAEMLEEDPGKYDVGDRAGLSGLQARYDDQLTGSPGVVVTAVASDGEQRELYQQPPVQGKKLQLTLDTDLQLAAERLLAEVGPASALVALKPSDGDIVVAANGPGTKGLNLATFGQFPPGSTFKSVSALALLRAGLTPATVVPCTPTVVVDGRAFENYDDYPPGGIGQIPLRTAVANSCNTAFISQAGELGADALEEAAASLGLGVDHDLGFPAYFGSVVPAETETEAGANMIGQGKVLASPMVMAAVIASVQAGRTVLPRLLKSYDVERGKVPALTDDEAAALRGMLRGVVTSGSGGFLADVPGPEVIAKTGTAEFLQDGTLRTHAWMIAAQGDLAVAVFVEEGASGSGTAGPILEAFLRAAQ